MPSSNQSFYAHQSSIFLSEGKNIIRVQYIRTLLVQEAALPVPSSERFTRFYATLFLVQKKNGSWHLVIDIKRLNQYIFLDRFKIESRLTITQVVQPGDWMLSVDLQEAYLHLSTLLSGCSPGPFRERGLRVHHYLDDVLLLAHMQRSVTQPQITLVKGTAVFRLVNTF